MLKIVISNSLFNPYIPFASLVHHLVQTCTTSRSLRPKIFTYMYGLNASAGNPAEAFPPWRYEKISSGHVQNMLPRHFPVYNLPRHYILPMVTKIFTYMYGLNTDAGKPASVFQPWRYEKISSDHV